jgi:CheY-like chemotaxis protein
MGVEMAMPKLTKMATEEDPGCSERVVLVVEDDRDAREALCELLHIMGYQAMGAADGGAALEWLAASSPPSVILLDCRMPQMSGLELLERLKADSALESIPVVFVTGLSEVVDAGVVSLKKPVSVEALLEVMQRFCD